MIKPRFPNSAFVSAPERFILRGGSWNNKQLTVRYGAFQHPKHGACLIDTGYSTRVTSGRRGIALRLYAGILKPRLTPDALPGAAPLIDHILLTHLHADHVSALKDYPDAKIYADRAATMQFLSASWFRRVRHGCFGELLPDDLIKRVVALESLPQIDAPLNLGTAGDVFLDGSVLAIPLPGHMRGHWGFLFPHLERPLLYAGDAEWLTSAFLENRSPGWPAKFILHDAHAARETSAKLRAFVHAGGEVILCHDPEEPEC